MNKLLVATIALVTVFSMPASAALTGSPPRFRDTPQTSRNTEANPEYHQVQSTEQRSQSPDGFGEFNDCHSSDSHDITCE
jgi:hypothetical protein